MSNFIRKYVKNEVIRSKIQLSSKRQIIEGLSLLSLFSIRNKKARASYQPLFLHKLKNQTAGFDIRIFSSF